MNKGDAILRLLSEIKLELKEVTEQMEKMQTKLDTFEQNGSGANKGYIPKSNGDSYRNRSLCC